MFAGPRKRRPSAAQRKKKAKQAPAAPWGQIGRVKPPKRKKLRYRGQDDAPATPDMLAEALVEDPFAELLADPNPTAPTPATAGPDTAPTPFEFTSAEGDWQGPREEGTAEEGPVEEALADAEREEEAPEEEATERGSAEGEPAGEGTAEEEGAEEDNAEDDVGEDDAEEAEEDIASGETAAARYAQRRRAYADRFGRTARARHAAAWLLHNCVAHPLLGIAPGAWSVWLHDRTADRLSLRAQPSISPLPQVRRRRAWVVHNCLAHPLMGVAPTARAFAWHEATAAALEMEGWM